MGRRWLVLAGCCFAQSGWAWRGRVDGKEMVGVGRALFRAERVGVAREGGWVGDGMMDRQSKAEAGGWGMGEGFAFL